MSQFNSEQQKKQEDTSVKRQVLKGLGLFFNIGWYVAFSLLLPTFLGLWLDAPERFNSRPWCTLLGFFLGTIIAVYGLYQMLKRFMVEQKNMNENKLRKEQDSE